MSTRTPRLIDDALINLRGDLFLDASGMLPVCHERPTRGAPRSGRVIDDTLMILSGELFADTLSGRLEEAAAPPPEAPRVRPRRAARAVRRRWCTPVSTIAGVLLGLAFGAGVVVGMEAMPPPGDCAEGLR